MDRPSSRTAGGRRWHRPSARGSSNDPDSVGLDFDQTDDADAAGNVDAYWWEVDAAGVAVAGKRLDLEVRSRGPGSRVRSGPRWIPLDFRDRT